MVSTMKEEIDRKLVGEIGHDLINMLTTILGYAGLAEVNGTERVIRNLRCLKIAGNRARDLVRQLQAFGCPSELVPYSIQLDQLVRETLDIVKGLCPPNMQIVFVAPQVPVNIVAHSIQIRRLVTNLCTNAIQAMGETGGILKISLSLTESAGENSGSLTPGAKARLIIQDTGCGMKPEILDRAFEPFFTTKTPGVEHGLGLGIVRGIIAQLKGTISVHSEPGKGTTVVLVFPIEPEFPESQDFQ